MIEHTIVDKWAVAVIELFDNDQSLLSAVRDQAVLINRTLATTDVRRFLAGASVAKTVRKQLLAKYLGDKLLKQLLHTLYLLVDYNLFSIVDKIMREITDQIDTLQGRVRGHVYSYVPLLPTQLARIEHKLAQKWQKKVTLTPHIDRSLLGGVKIVTNFKVIDESVRGQLQKMQQQILRLKLS